MRKKPWQQRLDSAAAVASKVSPALSIPIYLGSASKLQGASLKAFISRLQPEEARQVTALWKDHTSNKSLLEFGKNVHRYLQLPS